MSEEDDLKLAALYQKSRQEQPSAEIDRQIHNAASRAIYQKSRHWFWRFSTAAVVLLSFSVVLNLLINEMDSPETLIEEQVLPESMDMARAPQPDAEEESVVDAPAEYSAARRAPLMTEAPAPSAPALSKQKKLSTEPILSQRMLSEDSAVASSVQDTSQPVREIPRLPVVLDELLGMADALRGVERADGTINLYHRDKLILRVQPQADSVLFMAWPGAHILGIKVDWFYQPQSFNRCSQPVPYRRCELTGQVEGFFEGQRLDHIRWSQQPGE